MGLIPARAGTTPKYELHPRRTGAHPRSRGDHFPASRLVGLLAGSSPLARGPPQAIMVLILVPGLIPARAGTTTCILIWTSLTRAHPRSRGDH